MALFMRLSTETGQEVTYHKIIDVQQNYAGNFTVFTLAGFLDENASVSGKKYIYTKVYRAPYTISDNINTRSALYTYIVENDADYALATSI